MEALERLIQGSQHPRHVAVLRHAKRIRWAMSILRAAGHKEPWMLNAADADLVLATFDGPPVDGPVSRQSAKRRMSKARRRLRQQSEPD